MAYDQSFYDAQREGSLQSAREVVPLLLDLVHPASVVDVGCGVGTWLKVFLDTGVRDVVGVDGEYARKSGLVIPADAFKPADLTRPLELGRRFDLAICLEVGEHLPESAASILVESLTKLAPVVAFSAAIPFQGGTDHINEQWQDYWAGLFRARGFEVVDAIRPRIWTNDKVEVFYRQNILVYAGAEALSRQPALKAVHAATAQGMLSVVHPKIYSGRNRYPLAPLGGLAAWWVRRAASAVKRAISGRR